MQLNISATALAIAFVPVLAQALTVVVDPTIGGAVSMASGYIEDCPVTGGTPLGNNCVRTSGVFHAFTRYGVQMDVGNMDSLVNWTFSGGSHSSYFSYYGALIFSGGILRSSTIAVTQAGDDRGFPIIHSFSQQATLVDVPVRLPTGEVVLPLPESASWAMMIAGFGAIGYAMRRRRAGVRLQFAS